MIVLLSTGTTINPLLPHPACLVDRKSDRSRKRRTRHSLINSLYSYPGSAVWRMNNKGGVLILPGGSGVMRKARDLPRRTELCWRERLGGGAGTRELLVERGSGRGRGRGGSGLSGRLPELAALS